MKKQTAILVLLALAVPTFMVNLGVYDADLMEARNFITAREMLEDGHWWSTTMNGELRLEKPPLPTWITAIFGCFSDAYPLWLMRLPAAIMGLLMVYWTFLLGSTLFNDTKKAFWGAWVLASSLLAVQMARTGTWDIYFVGFAMGSFVYFLRGMKRDGPAYAPFLMGGVCMGLSLFSKGPVALVMLVSFGGGLMVLYGLPACIKKWKEWLLAGFVMAVVGLSWLGYNFLFLTEATQSVIDKESVIWTTKHVKPFYFYLNFPLYLGVWIVPVVLGFIPQLARKRVGSSYGMLIAWILFSLVLMSLLPMKKERYLLVAIPPLAMLTGAFLGKLAEEKKTKQHVLIFLIALGGAGLAFVLAPVAGYIAVYIKKIQGLQHLSAWAWVGCMLLFVAGWMVFRFLFRHQFKSAMVTVASGVAIICVFLLPTVANWFYHNPDYVSPAQLMAHPEMKDKPVYMTHHPDMRMVWEAGRKVPSFENHRAEMHPYPIVVLSTGKEKTMVKRFPDYEVSLLDSSGYFRKNVHATVYAYLIAPDEKN